MMNKILQIVVASIFLAPLFLNEIVDPKAHPVYNLENRGKVTLIDSLDQKIGSMLLIGFKGKSLEEENHIVRDIKQYHLGGVILFDYDVPSKEYDRNIESPAQLKKLTDDLQLLSKKPLFISIDQEGGRVNRLKQKYGFKRSVSAEYLGNMNLADSTTYYAKSMAEQLRSMGINMNFAPLLDVNINPDNPVIGSLNRSFSKDPEKVIFQAKIFINQLRTSGIIPVVKHFPGHGSSKRDSHLGVVDVSDTWSKEELKPYITLNKANLLSVVMTAHIFNKNIDEEYPATLSNKTITGLLKEDIGFDGVVISDDMQMKAIRTQYTLKKTIIRSVNAGVDILLFGNNSIYDADIVPKAVSIIKQAVNSGEIHPEKIEDSYRKIQDLKNNLSFKKE